MRLFQRSSNRLWFLEKTVSIVNLKKSVVELSPLRPHFTDDCGENDH